MRGTERRVYAIGIGIALLSVTALISSCSSGRSVEKFCSTYQAEVRQFGSEADNASGLTSVALLVTYPQRVADLFGRVEKVAPGEIEPDVKAAHDGFQKVADAEAAGATGGLTGAVALAFLTANTGPALQRIGQYSQSHCT